MKLIGSQLNIQLPLNIHTHDAYPPTIDIWEAIAEDGRLRLTILQMSFYRMDEP